MSKMSGLATLIAFALLIGGVVVLFAAAWYLPGDGARQVAYLASIAVTVLGFVSIGYACRRGPAGVLIDNYNRISLSRFQACLWTVVVLPAIAVTVAWNVAESGKLARTPPADAAPADAAPGLGSDATGVKPIPSPAKGPGDALGIDIPAELWILLGISATTLVAAGVMKQDKGTAAGLGSGTTAPVSLVAPQPSSASADAATPAAVAQPPASTWVGTSNLAHHSDWRDARFTDMFAGDAQGGNQTVPPLDFNRVQQLYLSVIVATGYAGILFQLFYGSKGIYAFPALSSGALALVTISHASYLVGKAAVKAV